MNGFPPLHPTEKYMSRVVAVVNRILQGKINAVATVTLRDGETTTTLTDVRIGAGTFIGLTPTTPTAAAALPLMYVSAKDKGSATLTHDNTADLDRTFDVVLIG